MLNFYLRSVYVEVFLIYEALHTLHVVSLDLTTVDLVECEKNPSAMSWAVGL